MSQHTRTRTVRINSDINIVVLKPRQIQQAKTTM